MPDKFWHFCYKFLLQTVTNKTHKTFGYLPNSPYIIV